MKTIQVVMAGVVAATLMMSALAVAQQDDSRGWIEKRVTKRAVERIEGRLNLTADQREQVRTILRAEEPKMLELAASARQEREEMSAMSSFDADEVREIAAKYAATNGDILVERTKVRLELRAVLNDAQRKQIEAMRARRGGQAGERLKELIGVM